MLLLTAAALESVAQQTPSNAPPVATKMQAGAFALVAGKKASTIYFDTADAPVVRIAARAFCSDVALVTGITPALDSTARSASPGVIVGTIGKSKWIDHLIKAKKLDVSMIKDQWERFVSST